AGSIPIEAKARRELERPLRRFVVTVRSIDCECVSVVLQEIAFVAAKAERQCELRRCGPRVLRVESALKRVEVRIAALTENERSAESVCRPSLERRDIRKRPDSVGALREQVTDLHKLVSRSDHEAVIAARNREVVSELIAISVELIA